MKTTTRISFLLMASKLKRTISFICLIALLSTTAGLLGDKLINKKENLDPISIVIVDNDKGEESKAIFTTLLSAVNNDDGLVDIRKEDEATAKQMLSSGLVTAVFEIPEGFFQSVLNGENKPIAASYNPHTPLQSSLIEMYVGQILDILKTSQAGIYTALEYTEDNAPEKFSNMYMAINARYINAAMAHNKTVDKTEISFTGRVDSFIYYLLSTLVFLLMLGCCLFCSLISDNFTTTIIIRLKEQKKSMLSMVLGCVAGWWGWYSIVGVVLFAAYGIAANKIQLPFSVYFLLGILTIQLCFSAMGVMLAFLFKNPIYSTAVLSLYCCASLFFSGGILPLNYLPETVSKIAVLFPGYWAVKLLESSVTGAFSLVYFAVLVGFSALFVLIAFAYLSFGKREAIS